MVTGLRVCFVVLFYIEMVEFVEAGLGADEEGNINGG
jgi:hypothetical protein